MPDTAARSLVFIISFSSFDNPVKDYLLSIGAKTHSSQIASR